MLAMSAQSPLNPLSMPGLSSFSAQEVQALQQSFQQQTMQQLALLQQGAAASQFSPQAQFYLQSHVNTLPPSLPPSLPFTGLLLGSLIGRR